jgi:hypothetical protein
MPGWGTMMQEQRCPATSPPCFKAEHNYFQVTCCGIMEKPPQQLSIGTQGRLGSRKDHSFLQWWLPQAEYFEKPLHTLLAPKVSFPRSIHYFTFGCRKLLFLRNRCILYQPGRFIFQGAFMIAPLAAESENCVFGKGRGGVRSSYRLSWHPCGCQGILNRWAWRANESNA